MAGALAPGDFSELLVDTPSLEPKRVQRKDKPNMEPCEMSPVRDLRAGRLVVGS